MTAQQFTSYTHAVGEHSIPRVHITSLEMLRHLADGGTPIDIVLMLGGGGLSRKRIQYRHSRNGRHWWLYAGIDDTEGYLTEAQLVEQTLVLQGIERGAVFLELLNETTVRGCSPEEIEVILRQGFDLVFHTEDNAFSVQVNCSSAGDAELFCISVLCHGRDQYYQDYQTFRALKNAQPYAFEDFALVKRVEADDAATFEQIDYQREQTSGSFFIAIPCSALLKQINRQLERDPVTLPYSRSQVKAGGGVFTLLCQEETLTITYSGAGEENLKGVTLFLLGERKVCVASGQYTRGKALLSSPKEKGGYVLQLAQAVPSPASSLQGFLP